MRKIETKEKSERTARRNKLIVGIVLIFLMVFSSLGYAFFSSSSSETVEESEFVNGQYVNGLWIYQNGGEQFGFVSYIDLAAQVNVSLDTGLESYAGKSLYIDSGDNPLIAQEIAQNIGRYASRVQEACYGECERDLPEKTCDDNLIVFRDSQNKRVYQERGCVFIEGDMAAVDAFLYRILGFI